MSTNGARWKYTSAVDNNQYTVGAFIDQKAFGTTDHGLLMKLERYGIREVAHSWVRGYIEKRYQYERSVWKQILGSDNRP